MYIKLAVFVHVEKKIAPPGRADGAVASQPRRGFGHGCHTFSSQSVKNNLFPDVVRLLICSF